MRLPISRQALLVVACVLMAACVATVQAPSGQQSGGIAPAGGTTQPATSATLNLGVRYEIGALAAKVDAGITYGATQRLFNAALVLIDGNGAPQPYLAESLPQLNTAEWQVFPDGTMETTYRLRPNLTWHDGQALTADDFVFAYQVYTAPGMGQFTPTPQDRITEVVAPDPRTVVIRWNSLYPGAGTVQNRDLDPLPRHILEQPFAQNVADSFANLPYWSREFVGVGPYRLQDWEGGSYIEAVAFDGHALGRPKIDRVIVHFIGDENTMMTNVLSGNIDIAMDNALRVEQALVLERDWESAHQGTVLLNPQQPRFTNIQFRPELASPRAILDLRVRRALASAIDRQGIVAGLFGAGVQIPVADQFLPPTVPYFADLDRAVTKYPYDLRQTEQFMSDAGYRKGSEGVYVSADGERFAFQSAYIAGSQNAQLSAIMADGWRHAGFDVTEHPIPSEQSTNGEVRATFPALSSVATGTGERNLNFLTSSQIPSAAHRWRGNNRGGWVNAEYDQLWDAFNTTLDRPGQIQQIIRMMQLATDDVAQIFLFFNPDVTAFRAGLQGPALGPPDSLTNWNVHEWTLR